MLAVILPRFNPCGFESSTANFAETLKHLRQDCSADNLFPVELLFDEQEPVDSQSVVIRGGNEHKFIFQKEVMFNQVVRQLPAKYDKVALFDSDLWFTRADWLELIEKELEKSDFIQPFDRCHWLNRQGEIFLTRKSNTQSKKYPDYPDSHPGFAWAMTRKLFDAMDGIFDLSITGGGDSLHLWSLFNAGESSVPNSERLPQCLIDLVCGYKSRLQKLNIRTGFMQGDIIHRWHGDYKDRNYSQRHRVLIDHGFSPADLALDGFTWRWDTNNKELITAMEDQFMSRKEDG